MRSGNSPAPPVSAADLHSEQSLLDPYPLYRELRDAGGAVWMSRYDMFAISRFDDVRAALKDWGTFSSARGVTYNERLNQAFDGVLLQTDPPAHDSLKRVLRKPLAAQELRELERELNAEAEVAVARVAAAGTFDAVKELAQHLPLTVVSKYVGLPEQGRAEMLRWAEASFNCFGPLDKEQVNEGFPVVAELIDYLKTEAVPGKLTPDGWGQRLFDEADRGEISHDKCPVMLNAYVTPSLDTTINAISSGIWLFAKHPDQWDAIRADPTLIPNAVNEIVRIESPVTGFTRYVTKDCEIDGVPIPAGSRVILLFASANRDDRKWDEPDRFDVRREGAAQQLGWGFGEHACLGMGLARLEMKAVFGAMAKHIARFEINHLERSVNMVLRGLKSLEVTVPQA